MMPGMPSEPAGASISAARGGGRRSPPRAASSLPPALDDMEVDAVQVVARLLGGDGELRPVDQPLQRRGSRAEDVREVAGGEVGKVGLRQALQAEARPARVHRHGVAVLAGLEHDLGAVRQLAHDVVEHVRRNRGRARAARPWRRYASMTSMSRSVAFSSRLAPSARQQHVGRGSGWCCAARPRDGRG